MFYELLFDMEKIDESIRNGTNTIYAEQSNLSEIEYQNVKTGFFDNIIFEPDFSGEWPNVEFYYSSKASNLKSDYLLNVNRWPIVHEKVMKKFNENCIKGIRYFPIKLIDVVTNEINTNYYVMYIENFIDAFDMEKSEYRYNAKYNYYLFIPMRTYLQEKICLNYDIFRCSKSVAGIYVSEKIKKIIEDNNLSGFAFLEVAVS